MFKWHCIAISITLWGVIFFPYQQIAIAKQKNIHLSQERIEALANHPTWLKLLHFDQKTEKSEIISNDFFLSPHGQHDPKSELIATIDAYFEPWVTSENSHARCKFPARYFWLSTQISLPDYSLRNSQCSKLEKWALLNDVKSVSLLLVSGYLGNPASIFGHSLLKLNTYASEEQTDLFDLTINYGALIPENEATWRYIARGILGGYEAGFSDKYFYAQDIVYSRTEFRDIWDYELNLSYSQQTLLVLHIWEVVGKKFNYYFLDKNCGYRLAELLEVVVDDNLLENARIWYAPVETFHKIESLDITKKENQQSRLIKSVRFIPSTQRKLYHTFNLLNNKQKNSVELISKYDHKSDSEHISKFSEKDQVEILDTLLAYSEYRLTAEQPNPTEKSQNLRNQVLVSRLGLPHQTEQLPAIPEKESPAKGNRPLLTSSGIGYESNEGTYLRLHWSPFSQEIVGKNALGNNELVVLDSIIGVGGNQSNVFVENLDIIRITKIKSELMPLDEESPWSWQLRIGTSLSESNNSSTNDFLFSFGAGRAQKFQNNSLGYIMIDASAHTLEPHARLRPHLGFMLGTDKIRSRLYIGLENYSQDYQLEPVYGGQIQYNLFNQCAFFIGLSDEKTTKMSAELKWYW